MSKPANIRREIAGKLARVSDRVTFHHDGAVTARRHFGSVFYVTPRDYAGRIANMLGMSVTIGPRIIIDSGEHRGGKHGEYVWASFHVSDYTNRPRKVMPWQNKGSNIGLRGPALDALNKIVRRP